VVKKLMRRPNGSVSTARPSVRYARLSCRHDFLLSWWREVTGLCICLDDSVQHDNGRGTHEERVLTMFCQTESVSKDIRL
jgi:hypothetical protein